MMQINQLFHVKSSLHGVAPMLIKHRPHTNCDRLLRSSHAVVLVLNDDTQRTGFTLGIMWP